MWDTLFLVITGFGIGYIVANRMDLKTTTMLVLQKICIPHTLEKYCKNKFKLTYKFHGTPYHLILNAKRGPETILRIVDHGSFDVTKEVKPYLGMTPTKITPRLLGYDQLTFSTMKGEYLTFKEDEEIII